MIEQVVYWGDGIKIKGEEAELDREIFRYDFSLIQLNGDLHREDCLLKEPHLG